MKLIIFDMDGTLINSGDALCNTLNHVRRNLGLENLQKEVMLEALNDPDINGAEFFYNVSAYDLDHKELFEEHYTKTCLNNITLYKGIKELLIDLKDDYILSVATNASSSFAKKMLAHLEIYDYFSYLIGSDMVENIKPKPDMALQTLEKLNVKNEDAIIVGDSLKDKYCGINADIKYILVNWGFTKFDKNSNDVVNNIQELENKIMQESK